MEPESEAERNIHLYHCDHRGLPLALINREGNAVWRAEYDEWGNQQMEDNPENLQQLIRLPGQQYDQEMGLYYNRYRYYDAMQRRYITQDPIGLEGGWNQYQYPLNPIALIDPLGLSGWNLLGSKGGYDYCEGVGSAMLYLPHDEAKSVIHNMETMHNVYNPLSKYVFGLSVGAAVGGLGGLNLGVSTVSFMDRGAACISDTLNSIIIDKEREPGLLALTCGKAFINKGGTDFQSKVSDQLIDMLSSYKQKQ